MEHLLFAGYLIVFAWLVAKVPFFVKSGLTPAQLIALFFAKIIAGIFYGWVGVYYANMAQMLDTWHYHYESLAEAKRLISDPVHYLSGLFKTDHAGGYSGFLGGEATWWNDLDTTLITKLFGIFNALSFGNYYINVIFYSFITLFGPIALYYVFSDYFGQKRITVLLAVFFIPSFIYWTSGLHKEGLLFNSITLIIYAFHFGLKQGRFGIRKTGAVLFSLLVLLVLRNYIALVVVPALLAWMLAARLRAKPVFTYMIVYVFFAGLFFLVPYLNPNLDFPGAVAEKQRQFIKLKGNSEVPVRLLQPTPRSFVINAPQAVDLSIIRPHFSDIRHLLSMAAAVEINGLLLLFFIYLIENRKKLHHTPFSLFCLFFAFSTLLIIGYTVNSLGAIVRYRSIVLPLLFVPVVVQIQWTAYIRPLTNINNKNH